MSLPAAYSLPPVTYLPVELLTPKVVMLGSLTVVMYSALPSSEIISTGTKKITYTNENANASSKFTAVPAEVTTVPGEDGVDITGTHALKLTGAAATTGTTAYAIEYIKTPATYHNNGGSTFTLADESAFNTEVSTNGKIYTNTACTTELTWATYDTDAASRAATYYRRTAVNSVGVYAYKVIRVN